MNRSKSTQSPVSNTARKRKDERRTVSTGVATKGSRGEETAEILTKENRNKWAVPAKNQESKEKK